MVKKALVRKVKKLPLTPGVYLFKNNSGEIIYVGKAARLRNRVSQYFQASYHRDPKTVVLVTAIADFDIIETESEMDALFLEAELIKRYMPHFNLALRDDKSDIYVRIDERAAHPTVSFSRRPLDDRARYFGPFSHEADIKNALRILRKIFPYDTKINAGARRVSLDYHLGLSPGLEESRTTLAEYRNNLKRLARYLSGRRQGLTKAIQKEMALAAAEQRYERAGRLRDQLRALSALRQTIVFSQREFIDLSKDQALRELALLSGLKNPPQRIEGYDISHLHGTNNTAGMVVFSNGLPDRTRYRRFKMHLAGNNDTAHIAEVIRRRFRSINRREWGEPDLLLIDGGRPQLGACLQALRDAGLNVPAIALAKRWETLIRITENDGFERLPLDDYPHVRKLLARIRDEAHRFAVSYQSMISLRRQTDSRLLSIPGIGPTTRRSLIRRFGSLRAIRAASDLEISEIIGAKKTAALRQYLDGPAGHQ